MVLVKRWFRLSEIAQWWNKLPRSRASSKWKGNVHEVTSQPSLHEEVDLAAAQVRAQWWSPELKPQFEADPSAAVEGVNGAISASVADECNRILGQVLSQEEEETHADLVKAGKQLELAFWGKFDVFSPYNPCKAQRTHCADYQGFNLDSGIRGKVCEGPSCGRRFSGSGYEGRINGDIRMRESSILTSSSGLPQCRSTTEVMQSRRQVCVFTSRWI